MGRKIKEGLEYFPWDVDADRDPKLARVIMEHPELGEVVFMKLCAWIYKEGGYRISWTEEQQMDFFIRIAYIKGTSIAVICDIVKSCIKWKLFDSVAYEEFETLTSKRIQSTWWDATRKRKNRNIDFRFCLLTPEEMGFIPPEIPSKSNIPEETDINSGRSTQSKVKESKVKESEEGEGPKPPAPPPPPPPPDFEIKPFLSLDQNKVNALADRSPNGFVEAFARVGLDHELLSRWMDAFHRQLQFEEVSLKQQKDYRTHFARWLKYQHYRTGLPEDFSPVKTPVQTQTKTPQTTSDYASERARIEAKTREQYSR